MNASMIIASLGTLLGFVVGFILGALLTRNR